jgi:hypothetical protein
MSWNPYFESSKVLQYTVEEGIVEKPSPNTVPLTNCTVSVCTFITSTVQKITTSINTCSIATLTLWVRGIRLANITYYILQILLVLSRIKLSIFWREREY